MVKLSAVAGFESLLEAIRLTENPIRSLGARFTGRTANPTGFGEGAGIGRRIVVATCAANADGGVPVLNPSRVLVILAAFNGEKSIGRQIETILAQEGVSVDLLIVDDCSTDGTRGICESYASKCENVTFVENEQNLGCAANFMSALYAVDATGHDYFAFSDQDDEWLPEKLAAAVSQIEARGTKCCLYYSNVLNVDVRTGESNMEYGYMKPYASRLDTLLLCGYALGCTFVFNRGMCRLAQRFVPPAFPRYHDTWLYLIASSCREATVVSDLDNAHILRCITGENLVGIRTAGDLSPRHVIEMLGKLRVDSGRPYTHVAAWLEEGYGDLMTESVRRTIREFSELNTSLFSRVRFAFKRGYPMPSKKEALITRTKMVLGRV